MAACFYEPLTAAPVIQVAVLQPHSNYLWSILSSKTSAHGTATLWQTRSLPSPSFHSQTHHHLLTFVLW